MITGDPSVETARDALHLGAFDYIEKPLQPEAVAHSLKNALDSKAEKDEKRQRDNVNRVRQDELKKKILDQTQELEKNRRHLLHLEKMAAIGQIAAGIAHEINNPTGFVGSNLNIMKGYVNTVIYMIDNYRKLTGACEKHPEFAEIAREIRILEDDVDIVYIMNDTLALLSESEEGVNRIKK